MTVNELENKLSVRELNEWKEYHSQNLFPHERTELQNAQIAMMISSYMGGKPKMEDFMLRQRVKKKSGNLVDRLTTQVKGMFGSFGK